MSKSLSAKELNFIKKTKKDCKQKLVENIKIFLGKKKKKSDNIVADITKISQKMKNKSLLRIEKKYHRMKKVPYYNYKKLLFRKIMI